MNTVYLILSKLLNCTTIICICCGLPLVTYWMYLRHKKNETERRYQILMSILEKNNNIDVEKLFQNMGAFENSQKTLREKLIFRLNWLSFWSTLFIILGIAYTSLIIFVNYRREVAGDSLLSFGLVAGIILATGIAFAISYFSTKASLKRLKD